MDPHLLLVFSNPAAGREPEFDEWYENTHLPEVLETPGVVGARRFEVAAVDVPGLPTAPNPYLTIYELGDDPTKAIAAIRERGRSGEISRSAVTDRASSSMWVYSPRPSQITE